MEKIIGMAALRCTVFKVVFIYIVVPQCAESLGHLKLNFPFGTNGKWTVLGI